MKKLSELFEIKYGSNLELSNLEITDKDNGIPFVSRTEKNNGISAYVEKQEKSVKLIPKHTLSVALGGTVLETFYQDKEYYSGFHIGVLEPINEMSKEELLYYAVCIKANKIKYSYGRQANRTLKDLLLPEKNEIPAWVYTKKIPSISIQKPEKITFDFSTWKDFLLTDLFDIERGDISSMKDLEKGDISVVSASAENNGITNYVKKNDKFKLWRDCLTISNDGSVGNVFYHHYSFYTNSAITILKPKKSFSLNNFNALFLKTIIEQQKDYFSYGRKINSDRLSKMKIKLPVIEKTNEIDWGFLENYSKSIFNAIQVKDVDGII